MCPRILDKGPRILVRKVEKSTLYRKPFQPQVLILKIFDYILTIISFASETCPFFFVYAG